MRVVLLTLGATLMPLVWGWLVYWAVNRFWPARTAEARPGEQAVSVHAPNPLDYQI